MRRKLFAVLAIVLSSAAGTNIGAQTPSTHSAVIGRVTDEHHAAIPGVDVMLREVPASATVTNDSGRFVIANLAAGSYHLVVRRVGYEPRTFVANMIADDTLVVDNLQLTASAAATQLPTVEVRDRATENGNLAEFENRRRADASGTFITPADMAKTYGSPLTNIAIARVPGFKRMPFPPCAGRGVAIVGSGPPPATAGAIGVPKPLFSPRCPIADACYVQIWLDGVQLYAYGSGAPPLNADEFQTQQIAAIEIYARGGAPAQYNSTGSACGTMLLWSKR